MKNKRMKNLNSLTLGLQQTGAWMIHADAGEQLHAAMRELWTSRDLPDDAFSSVAGMRIKALQDDREDGPQIIGGIAVVPITGMIRSKPDIWTALGYATANGEVAASVELLLSRSDVNGVLLVVDSPGGQAMGNEEATRTMRAAAERTGKPLWAVADGYMASAAYYLAAAASKIFAAPGAIVGSIGCVMIHAQWRPEDATFSVTRFGDMKIVPNQYEPIGETGKAEHQRIVDQLGTQFLATIAEFRGVPMTSAAETFGGGRVFFDAKDMQRAKLIDEKAASVQAVLSAMQAQFTAPKSTGSLQAKLEASCRTNHESGAVAAMNATQQGTGKPIMDPKLKAALYARGLIANLDASNESCEAALVAFFAGRGTEKPKTDAECLKAFNTQPTATLEQFAAPLVNPTQAAHDREQAEARAEARKNEFARAKAIRERGALLGVSPETIEAEVAKDQTAEQAVASLVDQMAKDRQPLVSNSAASGEVAFAKDAADSLALRFGVKVDKPSEAAQKWASNGMSALRLAEMSLEVQGVKFDRNAAGEDVAKLALSTGGRRLAALMDDGGGNMNRPSSFPNLLSGLSNKLFDLGSERAAPTYKEWTGRSMSDLPDLKEGPLVSRSQPYVMDEVIDDERLKQFRLAEEVLSIIRVRRFANKLGWTPVMVANDDLGAFAEGMIAFGGAWEATVNLLCLALITGNPTLLDGYALFDDTNHGNDIASSGAAPSAAQWEAMDIKYGNQRPVGAQGYVRGNLKVLLCPNALRVAALQLLAPFGMLPEVKAPVTDATVNIYRGQGKVVVENELKGSSALKWYGLTDPAVAPTVVRCYQRGWGEGVRRNSWTDPETSTVWVSFEGRVGAAIKDYRGIVRNKGEA